MEIRKTITKASDLPELTIRQQKMLKAYLKHGNATQAYKDAGYTSKNNPDKVAHQLIHRSPLANHLEYYRAKSAQRCDKDWITERLMKIVDRNIEPDEHVINNETAIKAMSELNKMQGNYAPVETNNQSVSITAAIEDVRNARLIYKKDM